MAEPPKMVRFPKEDAGAAFVLESKGEWWHVGFHLTTTIMGPAILTLPNAFGGLGWSLGFFCLTVMGLVTLYSYHLMSLVLEHCEKDGRRHIRFRELAADVLDAHMFMAFLLTFFKFPLSNRHFNQALHSIAYPLQGAFRELLCSIPEFTYTAP